MEFRVCAIHFYFQGTLHLLAFEDLKTDVLLEIVQKNRKWSNQFCNYIFLENHTINAHLNINCWTQFVKIG